MDELENIPWSEEGLSTLKYNVLKKIAKQKSIAYRGRKKIELIRALIAISTQPNSKDFNENKSLEKLDQQEPSIKSRKTLSISKQNEVNTFSEIVTEAVFERRKSLRSGFVGEDRRSTYTKEDKDVDKDSNDTSIFTASETDKRQGKKQKSKKLRSRVNVSASLECVSEETEEIKPAALSEVVKELQTPLKTGIVGKDRRSTYIKEDEDADKKATQISLEADKKLLLSSGKKSQKLRNRGKASPSLDSVIPEQNEERKSTTVSDPQDNSTVETVIEQRSSLKSGIVGNYRRSTYLKEGPQENCTTEQLNVLKSGFVGNDRHSNYLKEGPQENDAVETVIEQRNSLKSGIVGSDRRSTYLKEDVDKNVTNSPKLTPPNRDGQWTFSSNKKKNDSLLHDNLNNSFDGNEEASLIRVTPFKEDKLTVNFNENGERTVFVESEENKQLIAHVGPFTAIEKPIRKKGVSFLTDDNIENRVTPRKTAVKTPHKVKDFPSSIPKPTPCGKNVARNVPQLSAKMKSTKKMPNFSEIHSKRFKKMESLVDMKKRFAEKARRMLSSPDVPRCAGINKYASTTPSHKMCSKPIPTAASHKMDPKPTLTPAAQKRDSKPAQTPASHKMDSKPTPTSAAHKSNSKLVQIPTSHKTDSKPTPKSLNKLPATTPLAKTPSSSKINRFGFKPRLTKDNAKQIINKEVPVQSFSSCKKQDHRDILQGVRLNRRFTLQMQARGLHQ